MEKLYNNICLEDDFLKEPSDAKNIDYLKNPPEVIDVTLGRQLFVDDFLIEETELNQKYHNPTKYENNPILFPEKEWEIEQSPVACPKSGGVWFDEDEKIFKMWYEAGWLHNMCYAVSKDGIHWEKPDLGIVSGTNKILPYDGYEPEKYGDSLDYLRPDSTTVFIDYNCPKSEKYKLFLRNPGGKARGMVAVSDDGVNFKDFRYTGEVFDRTTIFYNPFRKKWVYSIRDISAPFTEGWERIRSYRECDNLLEGADWKEKDVYKWMACDELDLPNPYIDYKPQLYNVDCVAYESIMLGMFQISYGPDNKVCEKRGVPKITGLIPMYSRDGYHFSRPSRECIINSSMYKGAWDRGYVQSVGGVTVINKDELFIYYVGFAGDENYPNQSWVTNGIYRNGATGLAKLRRDGFVSMNGKGKLFTRKLTFNGKKSMFINAEGNVLVKLKDAENRELSVSHKFKGNSTKAEIRFPDFDLTTLNGKVFRIEFQVEGELYSFGFDDENRESGGYHAAGIVE